MLPLLRRALPFLTVAVLAAAAYDAWIFYSRWRAAREARRLEQAEQARRARQTIDLLGGGQLKILNFYAAPGAIRRGERASLCYGVYGAATVRIEPPIGDVPPAVARCLPVAPSRSTEYTLVAADAAGHTLTRSFVLHVAP